MHHLGDVARTTLTRVDVARSVPLATLLLATLALAACSPAGSDAPSSFVSVQATPGATSAPSLPSQTDTDWGRIWDAVPSSFPVLPGTVPATDIGDGAVSALLALDAPDPAAIAAFYANALPGMGMAASVDGPLEDGSVAVSGSDGYGCEVQVEIKPAGSTNLISVWYGAGCPF